MTTLTLAIAQRGAAPRRSITLDNGSEFAGRTMEAWAMTSGIRLAFICPGVVENGFAKSFNGRLREECLNLEWFVSLEEARRTLANWRDHYNQQRSHSALDGRSPPWRLRLCGNTAKNTSPFRPWTRQTANRVKGTLRRLTALLTRAAVCPKNTYDQGEALLRVAQTRAPLLARRTGRRGT